MNRAKEITASKDFTGSGAKKAVEIVGEELTKLLGERIGSIFATPEALTNLLKVGSAIALGWYIKNKIMDIREMQIRIWLNILRFATHH